MFIPHAGTCERFVGWVKHTADGVRPVGFTTYNDAIVAVRGKPVRVGLAGQQLSGSFPLRNEAAV